MARRQFGAFLKVLWLTQRRQLLWLFFEIALPLLYSAAVLLVYWQVKSVSRDDTVYEQFPVFGNGLDMLVPVDSVPLLLSSYYYDTLYYAPSNNQTDAIMQSVADRYQWDKLSVLPLLPVLDLNVTDNSREAILQHNVTVADYCNKYRDQYPTVLSPYCDQITWYRFQLKGFDSEAELLAYTGDQTKPNRYIGAVIFDELGGRSLQYRMRYRYYFHDLLPQYFSQGLVHDWKTDETLPSGLAPITLQFPNLTDGGLPAYWREVFLTIQKAIDTVLIKNLVPPEKQQIVDAAQLFLQRFPYPAYLSNPLYSYATVLLPLILVLSFMVTVVYVSRCIAMDQEKGLKEYLTIVGLSPWSYWTAYFLLNFLKLLIPCSVLTIIFWVLFPKSDSSIIFVFILLYAVNALCFAFAVSSVVKKGSIATLVAAVAWFLLYLPSLYIQNVQGTQTDSGRRLDCLLLNSAAGIGIQLISTAESQGTGIQWSQFWTFNTGLSIGFVLLMLLADLVILIFITIVFQMPLSFWMTRFRRKQKRYVPKLAFGGPETKGKNPLRPSVFGIQVRNLSVILGRGTNVTVAVKDVSFDASDKKITVLLGRNGSGKTTLLSVLAGLKDQTEGTVTIGSYDNQRDRQTLRKHMGFCPQYNPLFEYLTVQEHLIFFGTLKGRDANLEESGPLLMKLKLWDKRCSIAKTLSGGQQRKLSMAIALCGDSEVVLLDEPTSGLDPAVRKEVEAILLNERKKRMILMTTHHLDEADILGDQVLIMYRGKLLTKGSSRALKHNFGEYATVSLTFEEGDIETMAQEVMGLVKTFYPDEIHFETSARYLLFRLPTDRISGEMLIQIVYELDRVRTELKVSRIRVGITSLEDVFKNEVVKVEKENPKLHLDADVDYMSFRSKTVHSGLYLALLRTWAMLAKRFVSLWRQLSFVLAQLFIPIFTAALGLFINTINKRYNPNAKALDLFDLSPYHESTALLQFDANATGEYPQSVLDSFASMYASASLGTSTVPFSSNFTAEILREARATGAANYMLDHFFGTVVNGSSVVQFFNNIAGHSAGTAVSVASNAVLKALMGDAFEIHAVNQPLPPAFIVYFLFGEEFVLALCLSIGLLVSLSIFVVYLARERAAGAKHLQRLAGISGSSYWLGNFGIDCLVCTGVNLLVMLTLHLGQVASGQTQFLADSRSWPHILLLLQLHSWALLPLTYISSFFFSSAASGVAKLIIANIVLSLAPCCVSATLQALSFDPTLPYLKGVESGFSGNATIFFPQFAFSKAVMTYYSNRMMEDQCNRMNVSCTNLGPTFSVTSDYIRWASPGIGKYLTVLAVQGVVLFVLLGVMESRIAQSLYCRLSCCFKKKGRGVSGEENTWTFQKSYDSSASPVLDIMEASVAHDYRGKKLAVDQLSLAVRPGQCVCLMGHNGAGKTSLFSALTGQLSFRDGTAVMAGHDLRKHLYKAGTNLGYCPQFDALVERLTVLENLRLFARIRGIHYRERQLVIDSIISALGLEEHATKLVQNLSGGNKRKTSLGVAILGCPPVLLLDEPTTGIDPNGRLQVARLLNKLRRDHDLGILITSHSMDVIESSCTEIAVLAEGKLRFAGSLRVFAQQRPLFHLRISAAQQDKGVHAIDALVRKAIPDCHPQTECSYTVERQPDVTWSRLLHLVAQIQEKEKINDFEISEAFFDEFVSTSSN